MSMELSTQAYIAALTGSNNGGGNASHVTDEESNEKDGQFAQYLIAIKGAKLSETQLQKLSESQAADERTRTIEQLDREARAENEQYEKIRSNGYTVGEIRRGVDQVDQAIERKRSDNRRDAAQERSLNKTEQHSTYASMMLTDTASKPGVNGAGSTISGTLPGVLTGMSDTSIAALPGNWPDQTMQGMGTNLSNDNATSHNVNSGNMIAGNSQSGNADKSVDARNDDLTVGQSHSQWAMKTGKTVASSMVGVLSAMKPVSNNANTKSSTELDSKTTATVGRNSEQQERSQNILAQEALTAASEAQQNANDMQGQSGQDQSGQMQSESQNRQSTSDVAASQTLPGTSLMERVDQAKLTNRVASAFRSLANQSGTIRMKLHPEELGALTIRMQIESGKVTAKFEAETESAKQALLKNVDSLKRKLKEQNLEVTAFEIEVISNKDTQANKTKATSNANRQQITKAETLATGRKNYSESESASRDSDHLDYYS